MDSVFNRISKSFDGPVLVTGHTGFKGTWLTLLLERMNIEVVGYSKPARNDSLFKKLGRQNKIKEQMGDIRDAEKLTKFLETSRPSIIFHLAAQPLVMESYINPSETFAVNILGTVNVLESAAKSNFVKLVEVVTSDKVYANSNSGIKFKEDDQLWGHDPYSASKVGAEIACSAWRRIIHEFDFDLSLLSVRSGNVIGGGDDSPGRLLPDIVKGFVAKTTVKIKNPKSTRPWQHVLDPLWGYILAADYKINSGFGDAYNFGPKTNSLTVREILTIAKESWPETTNVEFQNNSKDTEKKFLDLDSSLAKEKLGWTPIWTQETAVVDTLKWWANVELHKIPAFEACDLDLQYMTKNLFHPIHLDKNLIQSKY
jgi:CDP-glucose 4,6-dehydratase